MRIFLNELPSNFALDHMMYRPLEKKATGRADADIWQTSQHEGRILITQDLDFSDSRKFQPGTHHGIVLIRLRSPSRQNLIARANELFDTEDISGWGGCFVVVTERKIRIRRPDPSRN